MPDTLLILVIVCASLASGAIVGHAFAALRPSGPKPPFFDLSDEAIAHILHEARRGYERSLGIIRLKAWNNLDKIERDAATLRVKLLRDGNRTFGTALTFLHHLEAAVIALTSRA